jgi:hypothetical protein
MTVNAASLFWVKDRGKRFLRNAGSKLHGVAFRKTEITTDRTNV